MLDAVFFETEAPTREEDVGLSCGRQVGDAVTDKDDERDCAIGGGEGGVTAVVGYGAGFVVTELAVVEPDRVPFCAGGVDLGVVGDDFDVGGLCTGGLC